MRPDSGGAIRVRRIDDRAARIEQDGKWVYLRGRTLLRVTHELAAIARDMPRPTEHRTTTRKDER